MLADAVRLHRERRFREAAALLEPLVDTELAGPELLGVYASCLRNDGRAEAALAVYVRLEKPWAGNAEFWFNRSNAFADLGLHEQADDSLAAALRIEPRNTRYLANRGISRARLGDERGAMELYREALAVDPDHRLAGHNLANLLAEHGQVEEATTLFRRILRRWPDLAEAHYNLGRLLLLRGDYSSGAADYEWRWRAPGFIERPDYQDVPQWDGRPFPGKRLVVHAEQGFGDTIQFSKLLGLVTSLGGEVTLHVPQPLAALLRSLPFDVEVLSRHARSGADLQVPLMSLVHRLGLTPGSLPTMRSHLSADPPRVEDWRRRLSLVPATRTIGVVWQGNPASPVDRGRSLGSAEALSPLQRIPGARLIAMQKLARDDLEPASLPSGWRVRGLSFELEHPGPDFDAGADAFLDTAAIMSRLDVVVSVCTAPLHLAGALGRPAIALLKTVPDWRWGMFGDETPWYPAMRLERQGRGEDFEPAIARAAARAEAILSRGS